MYWLCDIPQKRLEDTFSKLDLEGRPVQVIPFMTEEDCGIITDALKQFDLCYDPQYRAKSQLKKMPGIAEFMNSKEHCRVTDYSLEFRLCGITGCHICKKVGRSVRKPDVDINGLNLRAEVLRFMTLPIPNKDDSEHYLPAALAREHTETNNLTLDDLKKFILSAKNDSEEKNRIDKMKKIDKSFTFHTSKVRAIAKCSCGATRAVYSHYMIGVKDALKVKDRENRRRTLENDGYSCGDEVKGGGKFFYSKRSLRCGDPIESEYYNPGAGTKGGRIETEDVCCICYVDQDLMTPNDIKKYGTLAVRHL